MTPTAIRRLVRASALYDLLLTAPFATPWSFAIAHGQLSAANVALGGPPFPPFSALHMLFAGLLGSIVVVWSWLRLRAPQPQHATYDGAARLMFSSWMAYTLSAGGAPLLWLFLIPECAWGLVQWYAVPPMSEAGRVLCKHNL